MLDKTLHRKLYWATLTLLKTRGKLKSSGRVSSSSVTIGTHCVILIKYLVISDVMYKERRKGTEHTNNSTKYWDNIVITKQTCLPLISNHLVNNYYIRKRRQSSQPLLKLFCIWLKLISTKILICSLYPNNIKLKLIILLTATTVSHWLSNHYDWLNA